MASNFTLNSQSYQGRYMRLDCVQQQDAATNTSVINWTLTVAGGSANYYTTGPTTATIGGQVVYDVPKVYYNEYAFPAGKGSVSGSITVPHQQDGSLTVECGITTAIYTGVLETRSGSWTLDTIPRIASLTDAPDFSDEDDPVISYSNPLGEAAEVLQACISLTSIKADVPYRSIPKTGSSYTFCLTDSERAALRNATVNGSSRNVYFMLKMTAGGKTTRASLKRTLTIVNAQPAVTATVTDSNPVTAALTGDPAGTLVRYCSDAVVEAVCVPQKGAQMQQYQLSYNGKVYRENPITLQGVESGLFILTATDSRGNTTTLPVQRSVIPYVKLTCDLDNPKIDVSGNVTVRVSGNWFGGAFSTGRENSLLAQVRWKESGADWTEEQWKEMVAVPNGDAYTAVCDLTIANFDNRKAYVFQARAIDAVTEVLSGECTARSLPIFDWGEKDFNINGELTINRIPVKEYVKGRKVYDGDILIEEDHATFENCIFNGKVTIGAPYTDGNGNSVSTANYVRMINCDFYNTVTVNGSHVQLKNVYIGGKSNSEYLNDNCLVVNPTATDIVLNDFTIARTNYSGLYYNSYGGSFANFSIFRCSQYGVRVLAGGIQMQNGKIFFCGPASLRVRTEWCGGFMAFAGQTPTNQMMKYIPEVCVQNVSIQQNYGGGMHLRGVVNSTIDVVLMGNYANIVNEEKDEIASGDFPRNKAKYRMEYPYRDYGMRLIDCKNICGRVNGISCHSHWWGADRGYKDDIPALNSLNVTWESTYTNDDVYHPFFRNPMWFAKFLPEVHADIVNGLRIGDQFTEADCEDTNPLSYATIAEVDDYGFFREDESSIRRIAIEGKMPKMAKKGLFRLFVEAPGLNIYPYVSFTDAEGNVLYTEYDKNNPPDPSNGMNYPTIKSNNSVIARGHHNTYSNTFCFDVGDADISNAAHFYLNILFNRVSGIYRKEWEKDASGNIIPNQFAYVPAIDENSPTTGEVTPKIRAQFYPY